MSTMSEPRPPGGAGSTQPTTQEIPVVQPTTGGTPVQNLPPHPGAMTPAPVTPVTPSPEPVAAAQPTGPVDFVPGLPGVGTPPPPPRTGAPGASHPAPQPAPGPVWPETLDAEEAPVRGRKDGAPRTHSPQNRAAALGVGLVVVSMGLLQLGLLAGFEGDSYWQTVPLWSAFATVCVALGLLVFVAYYRGGDRHRSGPAWRLAAGGLVGLAVFWVLVVLPVVASDRGFVLTAALAALGGALWIGPRRKA